MVSLSVTRLVVSGGSSATGRRCDVVSVTELRSIANISLLMLDIDVVDLGHRRPDQGIYRPRAHHAAAPWPHRNTDCSVRWIARRGRRRSAAAPPGRSPGDGEALPTLCGPTFVDYREKPTPPSRRGDFRAV